MPCPCSVFVASLSFVQNRLSPLHSQCWNCLTYKASETIFVERMVGCMREAFGIIIICFSVFLPSQLYIFKFGRHVLFFFSSQNNESSYQSVKFHVCSFCVEDSPLVSKQRILFTVSCCHPTWIWKPRLPSVPQPLVFLGLSFYSGPFKILLFLSCKHLVVYPSSK